MRLLQDVEVMILEETDSTFEFGLLQYDIAQSSILRTHPPPTPGRATVRTASCLVVEDEPELKLKFLSGG